MTSPCFSFLKATVIVSILAVLLGVLATPTIAAIPNLPALNWEQRSDWINIKSAPFNAVGDGVADDTAAIQAAMETVHPNDPRPRRVLYFPPGTYRITNTLHFWDTDAVMLVGHGRNTIIRWGSKDNKPMLWSDGSRRAIYQGFVWDGNNKASVGILHAGFVQFEAKNRHIYEEFRNIKGDGIRSGGWGQAYASSEQEVINCLFNRCDRGIYTEGFNYYNHAVSDSNFYNCRIAIENSWQSNTYIRRCHFENSSQSDLVLARGFGQSIRRCSSLGSRRFLEASDFLTKFVVQDCVIDGWTNLESAIWTRSSAQVCLFDTQFRNAPSPNAPILQNGNPYRNANIILSNVTSPDTQKVISTDAQKPYFFTLTTAKTHSPLLPNGTAQFFKSTVNVGGKVFDAKRDFGAKGDDSSDDTLAVQACIDAARNAGNFAIAYFPKGRYVVKKPIQVYGANYGIQGMGAGSELESNGTVFAVNAPRNVRMEYLSVPAYLQDGDTTTIVQTSSGSPSRITYDSITVSEGDNSIAPQKRFGLKFDGLKASDLVTVGRLNGSFYAHNSGRATILIDFQDGVGTTVDGTETVRDGFIGVLNANTKNYQIRDNQNIVVGDLYSEQSGGWGGSPDALNNILVEGKTGQPTGYAVFGAAKAMQVDSPVLFHIEGYSGLAAYCFPSLDLDTHSAFSQYVFKQNGTRPVDFVALSTIGPFNFDTLSAATTIDYPTKMDKFANVAPILDYFYLQGKADVRLHPFYATGYGAAVATPLFSLAAGNYSGGLSVGIRCTTVGATIRYTTDGTTPSRQYGTFYTTPISISSVTGSTTIKAIAFMAGRLDSPVATATYTINSNQKYPTALTLTTKATEIGEGSIPTALAFTKPLLMANPFEDTMPDGIPTYLQGVPQVSYTNPNSEAAIGQPGKSGGAYASSGLAGIDWKGTRHAGMLVGTHDVSPVIAGTVRLLPNKDGIAKVGIFLHAGTQSPSLKYRLAKVTYDGGASTITLNAPLIVNGSEKNSVYVLTLPLFANKPVDITFADNSPSSGGWFGVFLAFENTLIPIP